MLHVLPEERRAQKTHDLATQRLRSQIRLGLRRRAQGVFGVQTPLHETIRIVNTIITE